MHFYERHGSRIAQDMGMDPALLPQIDLEGIRASFGVTEPVERLTYRELQERREVIRRRLEQHNRGRRGRRHDAP
jgi:ubiquinone biosynthesis protein